MKPISSHWADQTAARVVGVKGDKDPYVVASGVTPSGTVHIGNFREAITVDLVARALKDLGKKVRAIHSWDDFDTLRKVPKNQPNPEMLQENMRRSISVVPDPRERYGSYAEANEAPFEEALRRVGITPEFIYQHKCYGRGDYAEQIRVALERKSEIAAILNQYRSEPLAEDWLPSAIYCEKCQKDQMTSESYEGEWTYSYECASCGHQGKVDIRQAPGLKLNWRTDWPMRWAFEKVDFEPGGKEHSSAGGSRDTAAQIVEKIWGQEPPVYLQYDYVMIKGGTGKISSSEGNVITVEDALSVYDPQVVRWIFSSQRPNHDFALAFDIDVIKTYDEFDRAEALAYGEPREDKKWILNKRTYQLSQLPETLAREKAPYRPPFRELCTRLQICGGDIERTKERFYGQTLQDQGDIDAFLGRARCALNWLSTYAPEEFQYRLRDQPLPSDYNQQELTALDQLKEIVRETGLDQVASKDLNQMIYDRAIRGAELDAKDFFRVVYQRLIGRDQGPRLPSFMKEVGRQRLLELL